MSKKVKKDFDLFLEKRIILISILIILIVASSIFLYLKYQAKIYENGYPIKNIINNHDTLTEEHCYGDICIHDLTIAYYKDDVSSVYGTLVQKSNDKMDACVKIQFEFENTDDTQDFNVCYFELDSNEEVFVETYFEEDQKDLVFATGYHLTDVPSSEREELYESFNEEMKQLKKD